MTAAEWFAYCVEREWDLTTADATAMQIDLVACERERDEAKGRLRGVMERCVDAEARMKELRAALLGCILPVTDLTFEEPPEETIAEDREAER